MIVEVDVGGLHIRHAVQHHMEAVILGRDLDLSRGEVLDRMIAAVVPELELFGARPQGVADELVPEADARDGHVPAEFPDNGDLLPEGGGVARGLKVGGTASGSKPAATRWRRMFHLMP